MAELHLIPIPGLPRISPGDDIARLIIEALKQINLLLKLDDILVVAQKVVSKAEGRIVDLATVTPSNQAIELARQAEKDPRLVELILREADEVVRCSAGVLIVAHRCGFVLANAGIDASNVRGDDQHVLLLPEDCDRSCRSLRARLLELSGVQPGVIINDSLGRAWRNGTVGTALGAAGVPTLLDMRGKPDLFGRTLIATEIGIADEIAAAASLMMGQADEGLPVVLVRGLKLAAHEGCAADLIRPRERDLFR